MRRLVPGLQCAGGEAVAGGNIGIISELSPNRGCFQLCVNFNLKCLKLLKLMLLVLREMGNREALVEHVKTCHEEYRKGCEEFPCLWEVPLANSGSLFL